MPEQYFRHVDGGFYRLVGYARSADTEGDVVVYEHLWPFERGWWVRNRAEFESRFTSIEKAIVDAAMNTDRARAQASVAAAKAARRAAQNR